MTVPLREVSSQHQDRGREAKELLFRLQVEQFKHDELYHREITRLTMHRRLSHMALHFAKYAGQLIEAERDRDKIKKLTTDIFIITLSCSNIVNIRLCDKLQPEEHSAARNLIEFGLEILQSKGECPRSTEALIQGITIDAGRMAAACEKLDHIEDYRFRAAIEDSVVSIAGAALGYASSCNWNLSELVRARLERVRQKFILHSYI